MQSGKQGRDGRCKFHNQSNHREELEARPEQREGIVGKSVKLEILTAEQSPTADDTRGKKCQLKDHKCHRSDVRLFSPALFGEMALFFQSICLTPVRKTSAFVTASLELRGGSHEPSSTLDLITPDRSFISHSPCSQQLRCS